MTLVFASLLLLLGGTVVSALLWRRPHAGLRVATGVLVIASILCLIAAMEVLVSAPEGKPTTFSWPLPLGSVTLALDGLSAWFLAGIAILTLSVAVYSASYMQAEFEQGCVPAYCGLMCLLMAALVVAVTAADAVLFLIGWETMTLAAFFLVCFHHRRPEVRRAAWMYLIATHLGTALFLVPMFGLLAARSGGVSFAGFHAAASHFSSGRSCTVLFVLALLGFGTKAGFMPMHVWLPAAHPAAPTPVSALLSGIVIKTGIYGLLRALSWLPMIPSNCALLMLLFGMFSGVVGVLYALAQHDIKRLLAYHSVENIGIIGLGLGMGMLGQAHGYPLLIVLGYGGALLHVLNHALFKGLLFLSAGAVIHGAGTGDIDRLGGLARKTPANAVLFLIAAVSICGLPPFNGFVSEWILYGSLFSGAFMGTGMSAGVPVLGIVSLALMGGLALACFAKVFGVVFLGEPRDASIKVHATPAPMRLGMSLLAALCLGIGLLPGAVVPLTRGGIVVVAGLQVGEIDGLMTRVLAPAGRLSLIAGVLLAVAALLSLLRYKWAQRDARWAVAPVSTWGCGYVAPTARMQYTASSFAWSLVQSFRAVLWPDRRLVAPVGTFPQASHLESHTVDMAEHDLFAPLFRTLSGLFRRITTVSWSGRPSPALANLADEGRGRPVRMLVRSATGAIRRGSIHACMVFIVITLLAVFCVESFLLPASRPALENAAPPASAVDGAAK